MGFFSDVLPTDWSPNTPINSSFDFQHLREEVLGMKLKPSVFRISALTSENSKRLASYFPRVWFPFIDAEWE